MVTMKQIDEARENLEQRRASSPNFVVASIERHVEALLRQWWAQGCREHDFPPCPNCETGPVRESRGKRLCKCGESVFWGDLDAERQRDEWKARAERAEEFGKKHMEGIREVHARLAQAEIELGHMGGRATRAEAAMQSAVDRCRVACSTPPTAKPRAPNDWIDELIDLLWVTREHRDDARSERDEWQKIARHNKWELARAIERAERTAAEGNRLAAAIRGALIALRARTPPEGIEATLQDALLAHGGDESPPPNDSISRAEVKDMIERELTAHVSGRHVG